MMLAAILSLVSLGGAAGLATYFLGPVAVLGFLKRVPGWVWLLAGLLILTLALWNTHLNAEKHFAASNWNAGYNTYWKVAQGRETTLRGNNATLQAALDAKNAESDARAKALADSLKQNAADTARLDAVQKADAGRRGTLEGIRDGAAAKPSCKVPDALLSAVSGL